MKTRVILLLLAAIITVSFTVIGKSALSPKYSSADDHTQESRIATDSYQFN